MKANEKTRAAIAVLLLASTAFGQTAIRGGGTLTMAEALPAPAAKTQFPSNPARDVSPFADLAFVQDAEGGIDGFARGYLAEFREGGVSFTPALGRSAPQSFPLELRFDSIERGARAIPLGTPSPAANKNRIAYEHAGGIVEAYDVRADALELTFTFPEKPAGSGDLVVRGHVGGLLTPDRLGELPNGLRFEAEEFGAVRFGGVTGVDADGATVPGTVRFDGEELALVLPAEFVENASYPLVLDPLISTEFGITVDGDDTARPDTAYDATNDRYCTIMQWEISAVDVFLWIVIHDPSTTYFTASAFGSGPVNLNPSVAHCNATDTFFMVWQTGPSVFGPWDLTGLVLGPNGENAGFTIDLTLTPGVSESQPDVGSESTVVDDELMMVWNQDGEIWGALLDVPGPTVQPTFGTPFRVDTGSFGTDSRPAISKAGGTSGNHLVVWQRLFDDEAGNDSDCLARAFDRDGTALTPEANFTFPVRDEEDPETDGDGQSWSVVFEASAAINGSDNDIYCRRITLDGGALVLGNEVVVAGDVGQNEIDPAVAFLGSKSVVAWSEEVGFLDFDVVLRGVDPKNCKDCGPETVVANTTSSEGSVAIASHLSGDPGAGDEAMIAFDRLGGAPNFNGDVHGYRYEAVGAGGPVTPELFPSCGGGGFMSLTGPVALGSEVTFSLTGADPLAFAGRLAFNPADFFSPFNTCTWLVWHPSPGLRLDTFPVGGNDSLTVTLPCDPSLVGGQINAQWMMIGTVDSPWLIPNFSLSNIIDFTLGL